MLCMNGYDSDMAPELLLRSGKRTTEPALNRRWRLLQASTKLKVRERALRDCRSEAKTHWQKQRNELAAAAHGKTGRPAQELNHVNLVQELLALRETASRVNVAHHMWRHTTGRSNCLIFPRPAGANSKRNVCSGALRVDKARRVNEGSSNRRTAGAPRMIQCRFEQRE